jgi:glutathione S-transferase
MNSTTIRGRRIKSVREEHGLQRANAALADGSWLSGKEVSLADIGYAPYLTRLDHLRLQFLGTNARMFPSGTTA